MAEAFLRLPLDEQAAILNGLAPELGRTATVLEKDVWVCWVLQQLFQMPGRPPMAFKGERPSFDNIIERLRALEMTMNQPML